MVQPANIESNDDVQAEDNWLRKVRSAWDSSTNYYKSNVENRQRRNQALFDSKHPDGSKYHTPSYRYRSRIFRPKIRSASRKLEASAVQALFSTIDAIEIAPADEFNQQDILAAELNAGVLKHHLRNTMKWYQTCIGGVQDAFKTGVVISYNYWKKDVIEHKIQKAQYGTDGQALFDDNGELVTKEVIEEEVIEDRPCVELLPDNRVRWHPAASWIDPIGTSPYVCIIWPLYVYDIKRRMRDGEWHQLSDEQIKSAKISLEDDSVEAQRRGRREDPLEMQTPGVGDYDVSTCLQWFMIDDSGKRVEFWTLGTLYRVSDPTDIKKQYPHGEVPVTMGYLYLESHKNRPVSGCELGEESQKETNDLTNSRLDNIKLANNKRYLVRRGANVDLQTLITNAAGSATMVEDPSRDVHVLEHNDIPASSYTEQDRIDVLFDELLGSFSQSSIQSSRALNETVGGIARMQGSAGSTTDYDLRTIVETWLEPTLRQVLSLVQNYSTDNNLISNIGRKSGYEDVNDESLGGSVQLTVEVGIGASNPVFKAQQFIGAIKTFTEILQMMRQAQITELQTEEIAKELFGYIGYKDGSRFFSINEQGQVDPNMQALQEELQELTSKIESQEIKAQADKELKRMELAQRTASERKQRELEEEKNKRDNATKIKVVLLNNKHDDKKANDELRKLDKQLQTQKEINSENNKTTKETARLSSDAAKESAKYARPEKKEEARKEEKPKSLKNLRVKRKDGKMIALEPEYGEGDQSLINLEYEDEAV